MLFLPSTGDQGDLDYVAQWAKGRKYKNVLEYAWTIGHGGLAMCEYYLRTGDPSVLPVIQAQVDSAAKNQTFGGWAGRGPMAGVTYGGGGILDAQDLTITDNAIQVGNAKAMRIRGVQSLSMSGNRFEQERRQGGGTCLGACPNLRWCDDAEK